MGSKPKQKVPSTQTTTDQTATTTQEFKPPEELGVGAQTIRDYTGDVKRLGGMNMLAPTSSYTGDAAKQFAQAGQSQNTLLDPAMQQAQQFIKEGGGRNPYLEQGIQGRLNNLQQSIQRNTGTEAAMAGQVGSPAAAGIFAERMGAAAAPVISDALSQDMARRENLQAQFTMAAPQLGAAPMEQQARQAELTQQGGVLDEYQKGASARNLQAQGQMLNIPAMLQPTQQQTSSSSAIQKSGPLPKQKRNWWEPIGQIKR